MKELSIAAARLLRPAFAASGGRDGRLSIQTDPRLHRDVDALVAQAVEFSQLAENVIVKIPATATGIAAMEEAAYRGVSINATLSFTVAHAVAVGEALERAIDRRAAEGLAEQEFGHVVTIMGGRLDDWLKKRTAEHRILTAPRCPGLGRRGRPQAGTRRVHRAGLPQPDPLGGVPEPPPVVGARRRRSVVSPPFDCQARINENGISPESRIGVPVAAEILTELESLSEFRRAHEVYGMTPAEFEDFGAARTTLRQFLDADAQLDALVRDILVPAP